MGIFSRLVKAAAAASTVQPNSSADVADTFAVGEVPPPSTGEPVAVKLKGGAVELLVNIQDIDEKVTRELMGKPKDDMEEVDRSIRVWMFRDLESEFPDSVRVQTRKGNTIGWIRKNQSYFACELIEQLGAAVSQHDSSLQGRAPHLNVAARVHGEWVTEDVLDDEGNETGEEAIVPDLDSVSVELSWPVVMQAHGDEAK